VRLEGTRAGRPLEKEDVTLGQGDTAPAIPFVLPELDTEAERPRPGLFTPPRCETSGVHVYLVLPQGRTLRDLGSAEVERLRTLGYLDLVTAKSGPTPAPGPSTQAPCPLP
jgi:hypothetical protein